MGTDEVLATHQQKLRRGTIVLACLTLLRTPSYGYALLQHLGAAGFEVDANTLYPLLRRLERQDLLRSQWNTDEARPRKYYSTTPAGQDPARVWIGPCGPWRTVHDVEPDRSLRARGVARRPRAHASRRRAGAAGLDRRRHRGRGRGGAGADRAGK